MIGDPDFAIAEITKLRDELGATDVICWMHLPRIAGETAMRSVELFAREVMPAFAASSGVYAQYGGLARNVRVRPRCCGPVPKRCGPVPERCTSR